MAIEFWTCRYCKHVNGPARVGCENCGIKKDAEITPAEWLEISYLRLVRVEKVITSIKNMIQFFVILTILGFILAMCTVIGV